MSESTPLPGLIEGFFTQRLANQRRASPHTIASYRDTFRLLFQFAQQCLRKEPSALLLADMDAPLLCNFLDHLEENRHNCARSRNTRLAAIHSFFRYVALHEPGHSALIQRVLAIPAKRYDRATIEFLTPAEIEALLGAPDLATATGRRDRNLLLVAIQTGLRVSELIALRCTDIVLGAGAHVRCYGKGRKERATPLRREAAIALRAWLRDRKAAPEDPLFPNDRGHTLSRDAVEHLVAKHVGAASAKCPSLRKKRVSPHVLRHTTAMELLQSGVDRSVIALWLGHESVETTQIYLHASMTMKEKALSKVAPVGIRQTRYRPSDRLLAFLNGL